MQCDPHIDYLGAGDNDKRTAVALYCFYTLAPMMVNTTTTGSAYQRRQRTAKLDSAKLASQHRMAARHNTSRAARGPRASQERPGARLSDRLCGIVVGVTAPPRAPGPWLSQTNNVNLYC